MSQMELDDFIPMGTDSSQGQQPLTDQRPTESLNKGGLDFNEDGDEFKAATDPFQDTGMQMSSQSVG